MNAVSHVNEVTDPAFALSLNPFNSEARTNFATAALNESGPIDYEPLYAMARQMIGTARGDARGYSLLGAVYEHAGEKQTAERLYRIALGHSRTELHALLRLAELRLAVSDFAGALDNLDLVLRRWPFFWEQVQPILLAAANDVPTRPRLVMMLDSRPPWRARAIALLSKSPATLGFVRDLIAGAPDAVKSAPGWVAERETVVGGLVRQRAYAAAYGLFLSSLRPAEAKLAGYVFDGRFSMPPTGGYFGWQIQRGGSTDITLGGADTDARTGFRVRFLDSPARPGMVGQNLLLPTGRYRIALESATQGLRAPKGLYWLLRCGGGQVLARLDVPEGNASGSRLEAEFEVPWTGCGVQTLSLDTGVLTDSWRDRYQGEARFDGIAITRL